MYYINLADKGAQNNLTYVLTRKVKRLKDFKATDGVEYLVRKNDKPLDFATIVPIYIGKGDRLVKTNKARTGWVI